MFKKRVMLVALREKVDTVYCPMMVTPVTKVVPFSSFGVLFSDSCLN